MMTLLVFFGYLPTVQYFIEKRFEFMLNKKNIQKPASITIETALVLPLFLFGMLALTGVIQILSIHYIVGCALRHTGEEIALYAKPAILAADEVGLPEELAIGAQVLTLGFAESTFREQLSENQLTRSSILEDGGVTLVQSRFLEDKQTVDLVANYFVQIPFTSRYIGTIPFTQRIRVHVWVGYQEMKKEEEEDEDSAIVYVTPTGVRYHPDASCTYLKPTVSSIQAGELAEARNDSGGIYYACELCDPPTRPDDGSIYYITTTGSRYHSGEKCRGISHEVTAIPISEVGSRTACSKCGN